MGDTEDRRRPGSSVQVTLLRLLREGPVSRAELADRTGLSRTRLASELAELEARGLVREVGLAASRGGRRSRIVALNPRLRFAAVDLGATSVDVAITDGELNLLVQASEPIDVRKGPRVVLGRIQELLAKLRAAQGHPALAGIGMGVPGPVSFRDGEPVEPPIMPGWDRYPLREWLAGEYGCPVLVDNDVNLMALGERWGGVARSVEDFLFVKIGTGVGCGVLLRGEVYRGVDGCAGDIGHIQVDPEGPVCACGNVGCLEATFGGAALARDATAAARSGASPVLAERLARNGRVGPEDVGDAAASGDATAVALIRQGARRVGLVLAGLVSFLNPSLIVIGGGLAGLGHLLLAEIRGVVYRRSLPLATGNLPIVLSELGPRAGVTGAAVMITDHVLSLT